MTDEDFLRGATAPHFFVAVLYKNGELVFQNEFEEAARENIINQWVCPEILNNQTYF